MRLLLRTDRAIKTGEAEPELALELFIWDLPARLLRLAPDSRCSARTRLADSSHRVRTHCCQFPLASQRRGGQGWGPQLRPVNDFEDAGQQLVAAGSDGR